MVEHYDVTAIDKFAVEETSEKKKSKGLLSYFQAYSVSTHSVIDLSVLEGDAVNIMQP